MRSIIGLFMAFTLLCTPTLGSAETNVSLREAIREFNYALTVEWDQHDQQFYGSQVELFRSRINQLDFSGTSRNKIIEDALSEVPNTRLREEIRTGIYSLDLEKISEKELQDKILSIAGKSSATGANWNITDRIMNGDFLIPGFIIFAVLVFLVPLLVTSSKEKTPSQGTGTDSGDSDDDPITDQPSGGPVWRCESRNTCLGQFGPGRDDLGNEYTSGSGSGSCGYEYVCGYFY